MSFKASLITFLTFDDNLISILFQILVRLGHAAKVYPLEALEAEPCAGGTGEVDLKALLTYSIKSVVCVTRLGDFLLFGQLFKACGNNYFAQIAHIFRHFFVNLSKIFHFWATFIDSLAIFNWSRWARLIFYSSCEIHFDAVKQSLG